MPINWGAWVRQSDRDFRGRHRMYGQPLGCLQGALALLGVLAAPLPAAAQAQGATVPAVANAAVPSDVPVVFLEEPTAATPKEITLIVPPDGKVNVTLVGPDKGWKAKLFLSSFADDRGIPVDVKLLDGDKRVAVDSDGPFLPIALSAPNMPTFGKCAGQLFVNVSDTVTYTLKVTLSRPAPATIVVSPNALTMSVTRNLFRWSLPWLGSPQPASTVSLRDKSGQAPLDGIFVTVEQVAKAPNGQFDLKNSIHFEWNGESADDLPGADPSGKGAQPTRRAVPAGGAALIRIVPQRLSAGEYNVTLRFGAANSLGDDAQKLTLTLQVRDSPVWAIFALMLATAVSYAGTKLLSVQRQRLALLRRIMDLRASWLRDEAPVLPVVWARALLRQAEDLTRRYWLVRGPDVIDARLTQAAQVIGVLRRVRDLREALARAGFPPPVALRAKIALDRVVAQMGDGPIDDQTAQQIQAQLTDLNGWLQPTQWAPRYWAEVSTAIARLLAEVNPISVSDPEAKTVIQALVDELKKDTPADLGDQIEREHQYARLKVIWERRGAGEFGDLITLQKDNRPLQELFQKVDDAAWDQLKQAAQANTVEILGPDASGPDVGPEAYDPITFRVSTGHLGLDATFLIQHGLKYHWTFTLTNPKAEGARIRLTPTSEVPQTMQYAPEAGALAVSVAIQRGAETVQSSLKGPISIAPSSEFYFWEGFEATEAASLGLAAVVGIASGLGAYYANNASFGSFHDYLALFTWGVGAEQGKNFLQALQSYSQ